MTDYTGHAEKAAHFAAEARTANRAITAVHDLHKRIWLDGREYCTHCIDWGGEYPCPTVRAIQNALGQDS